MPEPIKQRIVRREDGTIFPWSQHTASKTGMVAGWMTIDAEGKKSIILDKSPNPTSVIAALSTREQGYIERIATLEARIIELEEKLGIASVSKAMPDAALEPGESIIPAPSVPAEDFPTTRLDDPEPLEEEPITFRPEPPHHSASRLSAMNKDALAAHLHDLDALAKVPDGATKAVLMQMCLDIQAEHEAR